MVGVNLSYGVANGGFHLRLVIELAGDAGSGAVQGGSDPKVGIGFGFRTRLIGSAGLSEQVIMQEVVNGLGDACFGVSAIALQGYSA
jgi:hypothetical protein